MLIGYARTSTADQQPHLQLDQLREAGCEKAFEETASGAQQNRPALNRAIEFARKGDILVIWKLDRLARSLKQLIETVEMLDKRGIELKSLTESIDTSSPGGKLMFHVFGALAEFERGVIRERTNAGLAAARARGRVGGRPRSIDQHDIEAAKTLLQNPNITVSEVADRLGISRATLYRHIPKARGAAAIGAIQ